VNRSDPRGDAALRDGWSNVCRLYEHLAGGGALTPLPPDAIRLDRGENRYGDAILGYARYYATAVSYQQTSSFWFGSPVFVLGGLAAESMANSAAQRRAQAMSAAQWRDQALVRTKLTSRRLLCDYQGSWLSFWHEGVIEMSIDLARWAFIVRYQQGEPLLLHGPPAPWFALASATLVYGADGYRLPAFAPVAQAIALRRKAITGAVVDRDGPQRPGVEP
jgi:hypothetical protein